jgi:hypothetical protein
MCLRPSASAILWTSSEKGVTVDPAKAATLKKTPLSNVKELQSFLGLVNWFKDFIPNYANIAVPLTDLLSSNTPWRWGKTEQNALEILVDKVQSKPILSLFDPSRLAVAFTDASDYAIGRWIGQADPTDRLLVAEA